jgi:cell division protein FtsB
MPSDVKPTLVSPGMRRNEVNQIKTQIKEYQDLKERRSQIKRRVKLIKTGWRNGIVGVELPNESQESVFYQSHIEELSKL